MQHYSDTAFIKLFFLISLLACPNLFAANKNQITILYDTFGSNDNFTQDWGFSALIEFEDKNILFDAGNNSEIFAHNTHAANIDLSSVDFAVVSHRHSDHFIGLKHLIEINPNAPIYIPNEKFAIFASEEQHADSTHQDNALSEWQDANLNKVAKTYEVIPNVYIISTIRKRKGLSKLQELSLALKTSQGLILVVGCSHPGITNIVAAASQIDANILNIYGGFHMLRTPAPKISAIVSTLKNEFGVKQIAPGHCTGDRAKQEFAAIFKNDYIDAELGSTFALPDR